MGIRQRTISTHPIFITLAYLIVFTAGSLPLLIPGFSVSSFAITQTLLILVLWWNWSLYSLARVATPQFSTPIRNFFGQAVFAITLAAWCALLIFADTAFIMVAGLGHFASAWLAAHALVRFELKQDWFPWWRAFWTFLLVFYLPIGAWLLRPRIKRLLARQPLGDAPN